MTGTSRNSGSDSLIAFGQDPKQPKNWTKVSLTSGSSRRKKRAEFQWFFCLHCGKEDSFRLSQLKHYPNSGRFCSRVCHYGFYREHPDEHPLFIDGRGDGSPPLKHKRKPDAAGYEIVHVHHRGKWRTMRKHRWLMEKKMGRKLRSSEHVHHRNGNRADNRYENLAILSHSQHAKYHYENGVGDRLQAGGSKAREMIQARWDEWRKTHWSGEYSCCVVCGTTKRRHQGKGKCTRCYMSEYLAGI